ncbi:MAG: four helix bundle protein [Balneolaceae bacterium]|nr:MAG: four helix bundle protein [Balneolaceae bacterium]
MSYKNLEIWKMARMISVEIHQMSLHLPTFELYETGSQIRRSSKSIRSNIVEGYGRRLYKQDFIRFLIYSQASTDETIDHLETLYETGSLNNEELFQKLSNKLTTLGKKINRFIQSVNKNHNT